MDDLMNLLIQIGPGVFFLALVLAIVYAVFGRIPRNDEGNACLVGAAAFVAGAALGIAVFCASEDAGNLCGLGGIFGSGPLLAGVAIAICAHRAVEQTHRG